MKWEMRKWGNGEAMKAEQGPGHEVSQPVFGISPTTISPAHN